MSRSLAAREFEQALARVEGKIDKVQQGMQGLIDAMKGTRKAIARKGNGQELGEDVGVDLTGRRGRIEEG